MPKSVANSIGTLCKGGRDGKKSSRGDYAKSREPVKCKKCFRIRIVLHQRCSLSPYPYVTFTANILKNEVERHRNSLLTNSNY